MRCLSVKSKKFASFGLLSICLSNSVWGVDDKRLWLPQKYQTHFLELKQAAEKAEALGRCMQVVQGTIDLDASTLDHPIYRILCRQDDRLTYNEMVDGLTFETLTTKIELPKEMSPEEIEAARLAEEERLAAAKAARVARHWEACEKTLQRETRLFQNLKWLQSKPPEPQSSNLLSTTFIIDFDASNSMGQMLNYTASCMVEEMEKPNVAIETEAEEENSLEISNSERSMGEQEEDTEKGSKFVQGPAIVKIRSRKR